MFKKLLVIVLRERCKFKPIEKTCTHPNLATSLFGSMCPDCGYDNVI